jgi:hypothetical protein
MSPSVVAMTSFSTPEIVAEPRSATAAVSLIESVSSPAPPATVSSSPSVATLALMRSLAEVPEMLSAPVVSVKVWPATTSSADAVASAAAFAAVSVAASLVTEAIAAASSASVEPPSSRVIEKYSAASARFCKDWAMSPRTSSRALAGLEKKSITATKPSAFVVPAIRRPSGDR